MPRVKAISIEDLSDIVSDCADALEEAGHTTFSEDDHEVLAKLVTDFLTARGVRVAPPEKTEIPPPVLNCMHGRPSGYLCPHCMGLGGGVSAP